MHHPTDRITHTTAFVTPVVEHWLEHCFKRKHDSEKVVGFVSDGQMALTR